MSTVSIVYMVLEIIIGVFAILGNGLVLYIVYKNKRLQTVTNFFIANLAVADFLVGLIAVPFAILSDNGLPEHFYGCLLVNSTVVILTQSSIFSLLAIAVERFAAIKDPYKYHSFWTPKFALGVIIITWVLATLIGLVPVFGWNLGPPPNNVCRFTEVIDMEYMVYFNFFACVLTPLIIMLIVYAYIFTIVRKQNKQIAALEINDKPAHTMRRKAFLRELKAAKSLSIVIGFFALCWLPIHIFNTLTLLCPKDCAYPFELLVAAILLSHANSALNPLVYAYGNSAFRKAMIRVFSRDNSSTIDSNDFLPTVSRTVPT